MSNTAILTSYMSNFNQFIYSTNNIKEIFFF